MSDTPKTNTEEQIRAYFLAAKGGDQEAFSFIYKEYFTPIYRYVWSRTKSRTDADDLAQEVFLKAYRSLERFNLTAVSPLAYFYTIARNVVIDWQRKKHDIPTEDEILDSIADDSLDPSRIVIQDEQRKIISDALPELTAGVREVIEMKFLQELSTEEVAEKLGKTEGAVRQLQMRGLQALREILKKNNQTNH